MSEDNKYEVRHFINSTYEVMEKTGVSSDVLGGIELWEKVFQGSLADCEAWIRLHESGYM